MNRMNDEFRRDSHKDPEQLEREIDATRAEVRATLEELEQRLSPNELLNQVWSQVRRNSGEFTGNLGHSLKENPVPALLTSVGIAWMMASNGRSHDGDGARRLRAEAHESGQRMRGRMQGAKDALRRGRDRAREGAASAREGVSGTRERLSSSAHAAGDRLSGSAHAAGDRARRMSYATRRGAQRARAGMSHALHEQPLILGAIGLAAGAIAGAALPPTREEDEALGPMRDRTLDRAKEKGAEGARRVREGAEHAAGEARSAMEQHDGGSGQRHGSEQRPEQSHDQRVAPEAPESPTQTSSPRTGLGY